MKHDATALRLLKQDRFKKRLEEQLTSSGVRLLRYLSHGPPVLCKARISEVGHFRTLELESFRWGIGLRVCRRVDTVDLSQCNLVVKGRASVNLQKGRKYLVLESERENDAAFSFYCCADGKLDAKATSLADFQVPSSRSAWTRREMLVQGFSSHLGCSACVPDEADLLRLPKASTGRVHFLVQSSGFNLLIFFSVVVSVATLAATDPAWSLEEGEENVVLQTFMVVDRVTAAVFTAEAALKMWAYSLCVYMKDPWNVLDLFVVSTGWTTMLFPNFAGTGSINLTGKCYVNNLHAR